jgi:FixJ family two-component response regulator
VISIVDDDESVRRSVRNFLSSLGFQVEAFASAELFLQSAHRASTGCLILDLRMPGMSGLDLLSHLAAEQERIPAIVLTGDASDAARKRSLQAGAIAFLPKPARREALLEAVKAALGS